MDVGQFELVKQDSAVAETPAMSFVQALPDDDVVGLREQGQPLRRAASVGALGRNIEAPIDTDECIPADRDHNQRPHAPEVAFHAEIQGSRTSTRVGLPTSSTR